MSNNVFKNVKIGDKVFDPNRGIGEVYSLKSKHIGGDGFRVSFDNVSIEYYHDGCQQYNYGNRTLFWSEKEFKEYSLLKLNEQFKSLLYPNENKSNKKTFNFDIDVLVERMNEYFNDDVLKKLNNTLKTINVSFDDENIGVIFEQKNNFDIQDIDVDEITILNSFVNTILNLIEVESIPFVYYADLLDNNPSVLKLYEQNFGIKIKEKDFGESFFNDIVEPIYLEISEFLEIVKNKDYKKLEEFKIYYNGTKDKFLGKIFKIENNNLVMFSLMEKPLEISNIKDLYGLKSLHIYNNEHESRNLELYEKILNMEDYFPNKIKIKETEAAPNIEFNDL